jgi:hypothetical protein
MGTIMKIIVPIKKPRNALVPLARARKAGAHTNGNRRQKLERSLQRDLYKAMRGDE